MSNMKDDMYLSNDEEAKRIYNITSNKLLNYLKKHSISIKPQDFQDIVQNIMVKILERNMVNSHNIHSCIASIIQFEVREVLSACKEKENDYDISTVLYSIEDTVKDVGLMEVIERAFATLKPREVEVLKLRFGFLGNPPVTLREIGTYFNLTRESIRQIEAKALRKLRHSSRSKLLVDYKN